MKLKQVIYKGHTITYHPKWSEPWCVSRMFGWIHTTHKSLREAKEYINRLERDQ